MKKIDIVIPTLNEQDNVRDIYEHITRCMDQYLTSYQYDIIFIDNFSTDQTRNIIEQLCLRDSHVKAIFNARNFGFSRSIFYGLTQTDGDAVFLVFADMQDPPELLPQFIKKWEEGHKVIIGIKDKSKENKLMFLLRRVYYKLIQMIADTEQIENFNGFGLYDKSFIDVLKKLDDPNPYLKGIVAEFGFRRTEIHYEQQTRKKGKTNFNLMKLYDVAMMGITCYTKAILRAATFLGCMLSVVSFIIAVITVIRKLLDWNNFPVGSAAIAVGVFFLGSVQLFFLGIIGEYIMNINTRVLHRPLVIEEKRINFKQDDQKDESA